MLDSTVVCRRALGCEWRGEPTAQLRPTWLAIVTGRARPDEPEVVGGVQGW